MVALMGVAGLPRSLSKGKSIMKLALTGIASVGILAVTVGAETANAQSYRRYGPARTYTPQAYPPQSRGSIPRGVPRTVPFSDPNSPEPQEVVILVTITACLMVETDSNRWRRAAPRSVRQPHAQAAHAPMQPPSSPAAKS
jgi:hypothetical protein